LVWIFFGCLEEEVSKGTPDRLVEVSMKRIVAKELHCKLWRADEGTQIPGELCAQKKVTCEPAK
jgi:hypothetical protein